MKKLTRITVAIVLLFLFGYFGLSGYVWYHDNQRRQNNDIPTSTIEENTQVLRFFNEKGCDYCHTP